MAEMTDKERVSKAFLLLKETGFWAVENNGDCNTSGWYNVPENEKNVVFYHEQDAMSFEEEGFLNGILFLSHSGDAKVICNVFSDIGFIIKWSGKGDEKIAIMNKLYAGHLEDTPELKKRLFGTDNEVNNG